MLFNIQELFLLIYDLFSDLLRQPITAKLDGCAVVQAETVRRSIAWDGEVSK